jgi:hypothetical protein
VADRSDLMLMGYGSDDDGPSGDFGFAGFPTPTGSFQPVGGFFGSAIKAIGGLGKSLFKKVAGGGSSAVSKAAKAARAAAANPKVRAIAGAAGTAAVYEGVSSVVARPQVMPGQLLPTPGAMSYGGGRAVGTPSIVYDDMGRAWRRAGVPVLWSGDLQAVKRVSKAASRAHRRSGSRRSVRR